MTALLAVSVFNAMRASLSWQIVWDAPLMCHLAERILSGDVPYRDLYDMNMPGTYLLYMLNQWLSGTSDAGFRIFDLALSALTGVGIALYCGNAAGIFAGLLFIAAHIAFGNNSAGQRDFLMAPFLILGLECIATGAEREKKNLLLFCGGASLAFAATVKPQAFLLIALCCASLRFTSQPSFTSVSDKNRAIIWLAGGAAAAIAPVLLWLHWVGGLKDFFDITFNFVPLYQNRFFGERPVTPNPLLISWDNVYWLKWPAAITAIASIAWLRAELLRIRPLLLMVGVVYGIVHVSVQHKEWWYHYYPLLTFLVTYIAYFSTRIAAMGTLSPLWQAAWKAYLCILALMAACFYSGYSQLDTQKLSEEYQPRSRIEDMTKTVSDAYAILSKSFPVTGFGPRPLSIQFFDAGGCRSDVWNTAFHNNWKPATRFLYPFTFEDNLRSDYTDALYRNLTDSLEAVPPDIMIFPHCAWTIQRRFNESQHFANFFKNTYVLFREVSGNSFYIRKAP